MSAYYITEEQHTMPAVTYEDVFSEAINFKYAIRRAGTGHLVFRAETMYGAERILEKLNARAVA